MIKLEVLSTLLKICSCLSELCQKVVVFVGKLQLLPRLLFNPRRHCSPAPCYCMSGLY